MKKFYQLILFTCLGILTFSTSYAECSSAETYAPDFCARFQASAICYCNIDAGIFHGVICKNMNTIATAMVSPEAGCRQQKRTSYEECISAWNCYNNGGQDMYGRLCSSTGNSCRK